MGMKKAIKSDPGGKTLRFMGGALPHSGSESGLMALIACLVSTPSDASISTNGNSVQALKVYRYVYPTCFPPR